MSILWHDLKDSTSVGFVYPCSFGEGLKMRGHKSYGCTCKQPHGHVVTKNADGVTVIDAPIMSKDGFHAVLNTPGKGAQLSPDQVSGLLKLNVADLLSDQTTEDELGMNTGSVTCLYLD